MRLFVTLLLLALLANSVFAQADLLSSREKWIAECVSKAHFSPKAVDDAFSLNFYNAFLSTLDKGRLFLTAADLQSLQRFRTAIDDDWNSGGTAFFTAASQLYKTRLLAAKTIITDVCAKPFDFSVADVFTANDTAAAATDKALHNRWRLLLKAEALQALLNVALNHKQTKGAVSKADVMAKEPDVRNRVKTKFLNRLNGFLQSDADYTQQLSSLYLNTFLTCLDPHSDFFDADARRRFAGELATENLSFGFALDENERGEAFISRIAPGSAAWACGVLNKGDVPVQLKWEGSAAVELAGLEADDIGALLDLHTKEKMELTVRKGNGQQQTVVLQKQRLANEDNSVKSYVLSGKQNIGYLMLPSFYTEWEDKGGSRCAADVAREIVKLKKDSIAGLILDLRFNGGGSLSEAVQLAGIFIDEGVVCQMKDKAGKLEVLKDVNRGAIYNGPMLVLVNGQSASASEVVAGALQDYHRAVIAGSPTFGKATGQEVLPLQEGSGSAGFVKLTGVKLYRPTGKTAQQTGVQPDVLLPDVYGLTQREADEPFALPADTVAAYKYFKPLKPLSTAGLQQKSGARLADAAKFREAKRVASLAAAYRTRKSFSLKWEDAEKELAAVPTDVEKILSQPTALYRVRNNSADLQFASSFEQEVNAFWLKRLSSELYIEEAFQILSDFIPSN